MVRRGAWVRLGGLLAVGVVLAAAGCSAKSATVTAPAKRVAPREASASASASISASDAALLKAIEDSSYPGCDLEGQIRRRAAELTAELKAVPFVAETTITLPGVPDAGLPKPPTAPDREAQTVMHEFRSALGELDTVRYSRTTGRRATRAQLASFRDTLCEGRSTQGALYWLPSTSGWSLVRLGLPGESGELVFFWLRAEKRDRRWYVVAAGRDASWELGQSVGKFRAFAAVSEWLNAQDTGYAKPVIYLYPSREQSVTVRFDRQSILTSTAPVIDSATRSWTVRAKPDGTLTDANGRRWPYLFWEGMGAPAWDLSTGSIIRGADTDAYLRRALAERGLSAEESAEFREYWVPRLSASPWVLVHWEGATYEASVPLEVTPRPDTSIRVFMVARPLEAPVAVTPQRLAPPPKRRGFTLVEWGGTILP